MNTYMGENIRKCNTLNGIIKRYFGKTMISDIQLRVQMTVKHRC